MLPGRLDVLAMASRQELAQGQGPLSGWPRLRAECHETWLATDSGQAQVRWQLAARMAPVAQRGPKPFFDLRVEATLGLVCQRCLGPVAVAIQAQRSLRFEPDEATAAAEDAVADEDVLALVPPPDWPTLVEDELLLALPTLPMHDRCPSGDWETYTRAVAGLPWSADSVPATDAVDDSGAAKSQHPFAALARLRTPSR
jgi:uncharacterized protein